MKMYIAVLDEFPDYMTPTLVAHAVLGYNNQIQIGFNDGVVDYSYITLYHRWMLHSFKKVVLRVNQKEFDKISALPNIGLFHENNTLGGKKSCAVLVVDGDVPNVLKFAKLWKPKE
jgi:hypothetical protein